MITKRFNRKSVVKEQPKAETYYTITLNDFVEKVIDNSINQEILETFLFKIKDGQQDYEILLVKRINVLESQYLAIMLLIKRVQAMENYNRIKQELLEKYNYELPGFDQSEEETLWKAVNNIVFIPRGASIELITLKANGLLYEKKLIERELAEIREENGTTNNQNPDRDFFDKMIVFTASHHGIQINRKTMLLSEFTHYYLLMKAENEAILKNNKSNTNGQ